MKPTPHGPSCLGSFNTLAQSGTDKMAIIQGNGSDLANAKALQGRSKRKLISQSLMLSMVDSCMKYGTPEMKKAYWNTYHCQNRIITANGRICGKYCKNRHCTLCCANRKADIINRYLPVISQWPEPYFVTLTIKAVPHRRLRDVMQNITEEFRQIVETYRKRHQRGKGQKLMGIRSLESNFNPQRRTYNPHFHVIVANKEMADILVKEWFERSNPGWTYRKAQKAERVYDNQRAIIEVVKYGSKIFTEPDVNKKAQAKGKEVMYVKALSNIFAAMKGLRIFDRFGFNLPKAEVKRQDARVVTDYQDWHYDMAKYDWINDKGERLSDYTPGASLLWLLGERVDVQLE